MNKYVDWKKIHITYQNWSLWTRHPELPMHVVFPKNPNPFVYSIWCIQATSVVVPASCQRAPILFEFEKAVSCQFLFVYWHYEEDSYQSYPKNLGVGLYLALCTWFKRLNIRQRKELEYCFMTYPQCVSTDRRWLTFQVVHVEPRETF